jgi:hypothetical protein
VARSALVGLGGHGILLAALVLAAKRQVSEGFVFFVQVASNALTLLGRKPLFVVGRVKQSDTVSR